MILLQSQDVYDRMALLDGQTGNLRWIPRQDAPPQKIQGHCAQLGDDTLCFYRSLNGSLQLRINERDIELQDNAIVTWRPGPVTTLSIVSEGRPLLKFQYEAVKIDPPLELDSTPMVEQEDYDFGLFVANVTQNPERRARIYR